MILNCILVGNNIEYEMAYYYVYKYLYKIYTHFHINK